jgi:hypothetical protein
MSTSAKIGKGTVQALKALIRQKSKYSKFYIRQQFGSDRPVNLKKSDLQETGDNHHKIEKYLIDDDIKKKRQLPSLTALYDDMLDEIPED